LIKQREEGTTERHRKEERKRIRTVRKREMRKIKREREREREAKDKLGPSVLHSRGGLPFRMVQQIRLVIMGMYMSRNTYQAMPCY
jgi:hypothetical protein